MDRRQYELSEEHAPYEVDTFRFHLKKIKTSTSSYVKYRNKIIFGIVPNKHVEHFFRRELKGPLERNV